METFIKNKLIPFLMIFVLLTLMIFNFNPNQSFAFYLEEDENISYDENNNPYKTGQLIVGYRGTSTAEEKRSIRANMQLALLAEMKSINAEVIQVKNERAQEVLSNLKKNPNVLFAEYDYLADLNHVPNDVRYPYQVYLHYMNAEEAWDYSKGSPSVTVAVIDSGIVVGNTDLKTLSMTGYNVADGNSDITDPTGHGTRVISVIGAEMDNSFGFAGVAPESSFMVLRVIDAQGYTTYSSLILALEYATMRGVDVVNMSLGGRTDSLSLKLAVDNAYTSGMTIVAAAGNDSATSISYPAAYSNVVGVGAVTTSGDKMSFSNTGQGLTVVAGGTALIATSTDYITTATGTSFASPYVAGMVALMYAVDDTMTPGKVFNILEATSTDLGANGYDTTFGYGVVNMGAGVALAAGGVSEPLPEIIVDTLPPVLTLNGDNQISIELGSVFEDPGAKAIDDVDGDISNTVMVSGNLDLTTVGSYTLSYMAIDQAGNISNIETRIVDVYDASLVTQDTTPPVVTLNGPDFVDVEIGTSYNEQGATAIDDFDGDISDQVVISGGVDISSVGFYTLEYSVADQAGNMSNIVTRTVEVFEYIELVEETKIIRDIDVFSGSLNRKASSASHLVSVVEAGQMDVTFTYSGKAPPVVSVDGASMIGEAGSFNVSSGSHTITVTSEANTKYTVTVTHPEREVPVGTPEGPADIIPEGDWRFIIYIILGFMAVLATVYVFNRVKPKFLQH